MSEFKPNQTAGENVANCIRSYHSGLVTGEPAGITYPGVPSVDDILAQLGLDGDAEMDEDQWIQACEIIDPEDPTVKEMAETILTAKRDADGYLWVHTSGDVILWPNEAASVNDDGAKALERWQVDKDVVCELINSGEIDEFV